MNTQKTYKPYRDRGVYRAAANPKSVNHEWAKKLVTKGTSQVATVSNLLSWLYRDRGYETPLADIVYAKNPLLGLIPKDDSFSGKCIPVPLKHD